MRILIVTPYLPHAQIGHGGGSAVRSLVAELARRHEVAIVSLLRPGEADLIESVTELGVAVHPVPFVDRAAAGGARLGLAATRALAVGRALLTGYPFYVTKYASTALSTTTISVAQSWRPDVIQVEYLQLALLMRSLRRWRERSNETATPRLILDSHELGSLPRRRRATTARGPHRAWLRATAAAWDRLARDASRWADSTLCVTDQDRRLYQQAGGSNLITIPLGIDTRSLQPVRDVDPPARVLFLGSFRHPPNRRAAALLCDHIWPLARPQLPDWELVLAGPGSDAFLLERTSIPAGVRATGFVPDLTDLFRSSRLFAAPLTEGGGIKIKILEAMARGIPVVTTPIGAEGITVQSDDLVAWAETPADFAAALVAAAEDLPGARLRAARARRHVERFFGWETVVQRLEAVYSGVAGSGAPDLPEEFGR